MEKKPNPIPYRQLASGLVRGFGRGTRLLTADGPVPVEEIEPGEAVLDPDGRPHFVLWQGGWEVRPMAGWAGDPHHPVVIAANTFGPGKPRREMHMMQQHRVMVETDGPGAMVRAAALAPHLARVDLSGRDVSYHAVVTRTPCLLMAENLPCEGFLSGEQGLTDNKASGGAWPFVTKDRDPRVALRP